MSKQNPRDQIDKASLSLMDSIKDVVNSNVVIASRSTIKIEPIELAKLLAIINGSIEEGFHRASRVFAKTVDSALTAIEEASWSQGNVDAGTFPQLTVKSKKKSK